MSTNAKVSADADADAEVVCVQLMLGLVLPLPLTLFIAHNLYSINLLSHPSLTLSLISVIQCPIVLLLYGRLRKNRKHCSYLKAVGRGLLGLPIGALVNALGAIALGAPVGTQYFSQTLNWSLMMSLFTIVPAATVFGSSWKDWQRIFAHTKPMGSVDIIICLPAHGAVIGAWFGAWPMPLDWERPWQGCMKNAFTVFVIPIVLTMFAYSFGLLRPILTLRVTQLARTMPHEAKEWPICVSYGAMAGYLVAMVASFGCVAVRARLQHVKRE